MGDARWERVKSIFAMASSLPPAERESCLDRECGQDGELRSEVEGLLGVNVDEKDESVVVRTGGGAELVVSAFTAEPKTPIDIEGVDSVIGRYKLREKLGEGGFGVVYVAEQLRPVSRKVALKIIKLGMDTKQVVARFEQERQALALMDHPNIAKVLDAGATKAGRPYFVMEYVRGVDIASYCDDAKLTPRERLQLFIPVCQAVQHAHQKGVIHRDLKPSNVLITLHDGTAVPKIIDFGVAKATSGRLTNLTIYTEHRAFLGTPAYMAPEQAEMSGLDIDTRADIYALGVLLYELLTGTTPFSPRQLEAAGLAAMYRIIREVEPEKPSLRVSTLGEILPKTASLRKVEPERLSSMLRGDLDWIVMKALDKDRTRRYDSASDFAADVARYLGGEAVVAAPPSANYRIRKFVRRNRGAVLAGSAVAAALLLGLTGTSLFAVVAYSAQRELELKNKNLNTALANMEWERYLGSVLSASIALEGGGFPQAKESLLRAPESAHDWEWKLLAHRANLVKFVVQPGLGGGSLVLHGVSADGAIFVCSGSDRIVRVYRSEDGSQIAASPAAPSVILNVQLSADGGWVVVTFGNQGWIFDVAKGAIARALPEHLPNSEILARRAAISSRGDRVAVAYSDGTLSLFGREGVERDVSVKALDASPPHVRFAPDDHSVITTASDRLARMWDASDGRLIRTIHNLADTIVWTAFSPDGSLLVTSGERGQIDVWDLRAERHRGVLVGHRRSPSSFAFTSDGKTLYSAASDDLVRAWDLTNLSALRTYSADSSILALSSDGGTLLTADDSGNMSVWTPSSPTSAPNATIDTDDLESIHLAFNDSLALTQTSGRIVAWRTDIARREGSPADYIAYPEGTPSASLSPDVRRMVLTTPGGSRWLWDAERGQSIRRVAEANSEELLKWSPDGAFLLAIDPRGALRVLDSRTGALVREVGGLTRLESDSVQWLDTPFPRLAFVCGSEKEFRVIDPMRDEPLVRCFHDEAILDSRAFSPDALSVAIPCIGGAVRIWDTETGCEYPPLEGHVETVISLQFSEDGRRLATRGGDHTARVWDIRAGLNLSIFKSVAGFASVELSPDGAHLLTTEVDGFLEGTPFTAKVWRATDGALVVSKRVLKIGYYEWEMRGLAAFVGGSDRVLLRSGSRAELLHTATGDVVAVIPGEGKVSGDETWPSLAQRPWFLIRQDGGGPRALSTEDGSELCRLPHDADLDTVTVANERPLVALINHGQVCVFDILLGHQVARFAPSSPVTPNVRLWFSEDDTKLGIVLSEGVTEVHAIDTGRLLWPTTTDVTRREALLEHRGGRAISSDRMGCYLVDLESGDRLANLWPITPGSRSLVEVFDSGRRIATAREGLAEVVVSAPSRLRGGSRFIKREVGIVCMAAARASTSLAAAYANGDVLVMQTDAEDQTTTLTDAGDRPASALALSDLGESLYVARSDGTLFAYSLPSLQRRWSSPLSAGTIDAIDVDRSGSRLAVWTKEGLRLVDAGNGQQISFLRQASRPPAPLSVFGFDQPWIAVATEGKNVSIVDLESGRVRHFTPGGGLIQCVQSSPDGTRVALACDDRTIVLCDVRDGVEVARLRGHEAPVLSVTFSPDGKRLVSSASDGTVRLWTTSRFELVHTLSGFDREQLRSAAFAEAGDTLLIVRDDYVQTRRAPAHTTLLGPESDVDATKVESFVRVPRSEAIHQP